MKRQFLLFIAFLFMGISYALAQKKVSGVVLSAEENEPIVGASVLVKGTTIGTITDIDGKFEIGNIPSSSTVVIISYIGMKSQELTIKPNLTVFLHSDSESLDEVVVVAYGTSKKSSLTGAISSVDKKQIEMRPTSSVTSALEGTTSGVQINSTYGQPGQDASIRIRGFGTVNGSSSPLYVIDGVPFGGNISDLNSSDIESFSVLKDAASCALYGNRASNGVILITTKKGVSEKASFDLKITQGTYSRGIKEYKRTNARQFMETSWQNLKNAMLSTGNYNNAEAAAYASEHLIEDQLYLNIFNKADNALFDANGKMAADAQILSGYADDLDWYSDAIRNGYRQEYTLSGNAASEKSNYYFSLGYLDEQGYVKKSGFNRLSGRAVINLTPKKWFKAGLNISVSHQESEITNGDSSNSYSNAFMYCRQIAPIYPIHLHNADGSYRLDYLGNKQYDPGYYIDDSGESISTRNQYSDRHVIWENDLDERKTFRNTMETIVYADFKFLNDFTFTLKGDLNLRNQEHRTYNNATIGDGKGNGGRTGRTIYRYKNYTFQQQLNWAHTFEQKHSVDALLAHENYSYNYDYNYGYKTTETFAGKDNLSNFTNITSLDGYQADYRTESYLARVRYNYDDRYNVEGSFRRDGSSRFAKDKRWGNFFSVGANWVISNEEFMKPYTWVDNLKLRANFGQVGNDAGSGYYGYMALYTSNQNANLGAYYLSQNAAEELRWETSQAYGIGVDARLFNRWNISVEYFNKENKDLLFDVYLPLSAGATSSSYAEATITKNIGTISNKGFEINTDVDVYKNKDWKVNFGANASFIKNEITKLPEQNKDGIVSGNYKIVEGKSRYEFYMPTFEGVDQLTGNSMYKPNVDDYYIADANGNVIMGNAEGTQIAAENLTEINGKYYVNNTTYAQKEFQGSAIPKVYGSFSGSVSYKSLSLSTIFTYSLGGKLYDGVYASMMSTGGTPSNYHADILNSWVEAPAGMTENSSDRLLAGGIPQINSSMSSNNNAASSRWLTSADYLVMKNITLSYQLPKAWVHHLDLQGVGLSVTCENLFTLTARQGMNPQQSFGGGQSNYLVTPRVFSVGLNIKL